MNPVNVKRATPDDIIHFIKLGREFARIANEPFDRESAAQHMEWVFSNDQAAAFMAVDVDGKVVGMAGVMAFPTLWDQGRKVATELWWYVDPSERNAGIGGALMDALESWAKENDAYRLFMLTIVGIGPGVDEMYRRRGYSEHERSYMKEF